MGSGGPVRQKYYPINDSRDRLLFLTPANFDSHLLGMSTRVIFLAWER